jgi:hypothetical protein
MQSPDNTLIGAGGIGSGGAITDADGNVWTITANGQVAVNGQADPATANVTHLAYAGGLVWQENTDNLWWSKTSPTAQWSPPYGTETVPVPIEASRNETVIGASTGGPAVSITDAGGNTWAITNGQVAVNGAIDPTTANVIELAYVNGQIWQENSQGLWWSKSAPADAWSPPYGTPDIPISGTFYVDNTAGNFAVINVGKLTASPEGGVGLAPLSVTEIVTTGVAATGTTITVSTETATLVLDGNSSLTDGARLNLIGAYRTPTEISGPVQNNGVMRVNDSSIEVGALSGNGAIEAFNGSTLQIQSAADIESAAGGNTILLRASHLDIGGQNGVAGGLSFLAPITMNNTSTVTLNATQATSEVLTRLGASISEVFLYNGTTEVADLKINGVSQLYATETGSGAGAMVVLSTTHTGSDLPIVSHVS